MMGRLPIWARIVGVSVFLASLVLLSNQGRYGPDGVPAVTSRDQYSTVLKEAQGLAMPLVQRYDEGTLLNEEEKEKLARAGKLYEALNRYAPTVMGPYFMSGKIAMILGDDERAEERLLQAIANERHVTSEDRREAARLTKFEAHHLLSQIYTQRDLPEHALADAKTAAAGVPNNPQYQAAVASAYLQLGRLNEAKAAAKRALELDPANTRASGLLSLIDVASQPQANE